MTSSKQPVVLVVEDNPTGIASLVGILGSSCDLVIARTLAEARECLAPEVDIILLDLYLPDGRGADMLTYLRTDQARHQPPVICISASEDTNDIEEAFQLGATDYVLKPFNKTILSAKVSTFVDLKRKTDILSSQVLKDPLTDIGNRRHFDQQLDTEWRRAKRQGLPLAVVLIDLDNFKTLNDHYGHAQGDLGLQQVARALSATFSRAGEVVARIGGDEFAAILPGLGLEATVASAGRLAAALQDEQACGHHGKDENPVFTVSVGCHAMVPDNNSSAKQLLEMADQQLYDAKEGGRRGCLRPLI